MAVRSSTLVLMGFLCLALIGVAYKQSNLFYEHSTSSKQDENLDAEGHLKKARSFMGAMDPREEIECRKAIDKRNGVYPDAWNQLSWFLARKLRFSEAQKAVEKYIEQAEHLPHEITKINPIDRTATTHFDTKEWKKHEIERMETYGKAVEIQSEINSTEKPREESLLEYIKIVSGHGERREMNALPVARKAVELYPRSSRCHAALARILNMCGEGLKGEAVKTAHRAVDLDTRSAEAHFVLGQVYSWWICEDQQLFSKRWAKAAEELEIALELSGGKLTEAWGWLAEAYSFIGFKEKELEALKNSMKSEKFNPDHLSKTKERIEYLEDVLKQEKK